MSANSSPNQTPSSAFARQVIALFEEPPLRGARFPELDLETLQAAALALNQAQLELERLERELEQARAARDASALALDAKAERGLAYARVFAAGDVDLSARVARVDGKAQADKADDDAEAAPRKRSRKKGRESVPELFEADPAPGGVLTSAPEISAEVGHA